MKDVLFALILAFAQPDGSAIAVPLARDMNWEQCLDAKAYYLEHDPLTPGIALCVDQNLLKEERVEPA